MVECARLEIGCAERYRGFESRPLRQFICYCKTKQYCNATTKVIVLFLRVGAKKSYMKKIMIFDYRIKDQLILK